MQCNMTYRCFENEIVSGFFCNPAKESGFERHNPFDGLIGCTQIYVSFKEVITIAGHDHEDMVVAQFDIKSILNETEKVYPIRKVWDDGYVHGVFGKCNKDNNI